MDVHGQQVHVLVPVQVGKPAVVKGAVEAVETTAGGDILQLSGTQAAQQGEPVAPGVECGEVRAAVPVQVLHQHLGDPAAR